jgi:hypothetical protein
VKGVTVSRGPALKKGPGDHENKRKTEEQIKFTHFGPYISGFKGPKFPGT